MSDVATEFLFEIDAVLREPNLVIGGAPDGMRMIAHVDGGTFEGPKIKGTMPASGGDWVLARADGSLKIDVRAALTTDDGHNIYVYYGGRIVMPPEQLGVMGDRDAREALDPATYYFRTNPLFEAAMDGPYAWLNHVVAVGIGRLTAKGVAYKVYAVK